MSISNKLTILFLLMAVTVGYSFYNKKSLDNYFEQSRSTILKKVPTDLKLKNFKTNKDITLTKLAASGSGLVVHFWGTWCAPCEYELPSFLKFAAELKKLKVKVLLLAVNDKDKKIIKFMKKFGDLPSNVLISHDVVGLSMKSFGVVKVPETFLFDKNGLTLTKFSGPQEWDKAFYLQRVKSFLAL